LKGLDFAAERDWPNRQASQFVEVVGARLHVQTLRHGADDGRPVALLLHGTGASTHSFRDLAEILADRFTTVAIDLPGQGFSRVDDDFELSPQGIADAVAAALRELQLSPRVIVGHSAGAAVGVLLVPVLAEDAAAIDASDVDDADAHHVALFVGVSAALLPWPGVLGVVMPLAAKLLAKAPFAARLFAWRARLPGSVERMVKSTGSTIDDVGVELYRRLAGAPGHVDGVLRMLAAWDLLEVSERAPLASTLTQKMILIAGARDRAVPLREQERASTLLKTTLQVIQGAGHLVHEERALDVARLIERAADELGLRRPEAVAS
jgi:magnesium chelatase accessory protein